MIEVPWLGLTFVRRYSRAAGHNSRKAVGVEVAAHNKDGSGSNASDGNRRPTTVPC
jgi:hypothetical protein